MWNPFSRKRPAPEPPPSADGPLFSPHNARYEGRPLLILLENYVLAAIGELPADRSAGVGAMGRKRWGGDEDWRRPLRRELDLEDSLDEGLRTLWARNQAIATENGVELSPVEFARLVADENFGPLVDGRG